jgi:hypothetical protein
MTIPNDSQVSFASQKMSDRKPILADHKKVKSKLVTPFNDAFGPMHEVSWINTMIPELLWIALVQDKYGPRRGVEIITAFTRDVRASEPSRQEVIWAAVGKYASIPAEELQALVQVKGGAYADELRAAVMPFASWYPAHPLNALFRGAAPSGRLEGLAHLKSILASLFDRAARDSVMVQATAIWIAFDAGKLKVAPHLALADFPKIEEYPDTERSRQVAASIRATLNQLFGDSKWMASGTDWPVAFWNRGLEIESCE